MGKTTCLCLSAGLLVIAACHGDGPGPGFPEAVETEAEFDGTFAAQDVRLDGGTAGASASMLPQIACSGSKVYVIWEDLRNGARWDIYFTRSLDGGKTWSPDVRLDPGTAGATDSMEPRIACDGDSVYAVWMERAYGANMDICFRRSLDAGATWSADVRLDPDGAGLKASEKPQIVASGSNVYVAWHDKANGLLEDVYCRASSDRGATWGPANRLDLGSAPGTKSSLYPKIAASGSNVFVAWHDLRTSPSQVWMNRSLDGGQTWLNPDIKVSTGPSASNWPTIGCDGQSVTVAWRDYRDGNVHVYFQRSLDAGAGWLPADARVDTDADGPGTSEYPFLAHEGATVIVAWQDLRTAGLKIRRSTDGGTTWPSPELRIDTNGQAVGYQSPGVLRLAGGRAFLAWTDARNGDVDVYFAWSSDGGATWSAEQRLDKGATANSEDVALATDGTRVYATWNDDRNGAADVYLIRSVP